MVEWTVFFRNSIASHLMRAIFGIYFIIAISVTIAQLYLEYGHQKNQIKQEIKLLELSFRQTLSEALWTENEDAIPLIIRGILRNKVVLGAKLLNEDDEVIHSIGEIIDKDENYVNSGEYFINKAREHQFPEKYDEKIPTPMVIPAGTMRAQFFNKLFPSSFQLTFLDEGGEVNQLGKILIYSGDQVVFNFIEYGFFLIIINSLIKTALLWIIMLFYIRKILGNPIVDLTSQIQNTNIFNLSPIETHYPYNNELSIMKESYNSMIANLKVAKEKIDADSLEIAQKNKELNDYKINLENKVRERTRDLAKATLDAQSANRLKSEFLANMSHEIRTPLNAIQGFAEILKIKIKDKSLDTYLVSILNSGRSLLTIINDIIDLSKIEAKQVSLKSSPVNFKKLMQELEYEFSPRAKEKGLNYYFEVSEDSPQYVLIDEVRLRQILAHLIKNGIKFTHSGYVKIFCKFQKFPNKGTYSLTLVIEDTGIGIPEEMKDQILTAFGQQFGNATSKYGGLGMGLTISQKLIDLMGGTLTIESDVGSGSKFVIHFNDIQLADVDQEEEEDFLVNISQVKFEPAKILIVEDLELNRELLKELFKGFDFEVFMAINGKDGLNSVQANKPDLILLDIKMPEKDGMEVIDELKGNEITKNIPIIVLSASVTQAQELIIKKKCEGFIKKPIEKEKLFKTLIKYLKTTKKDENVIQGEKVDDNVLSDKARENIPHIISKIHHLKKDWRELCETLTITDVEDFSDEIITIGEEYDFQKLVSWGESLKEKSAAFNIDQLSQTLLELPIIEKFLLREKGKKKVS